MNQHGIFHAAAASIMQYVQADAYSVMITLLLRQNDVVTSFWRNDNVIITPCVPYGEIFAHVLRRMSTRFKIL